MRKYLLTIAALVPTAAGAIVPDEVVFARANPTPAATNAPFTTTDGTASAGVAGFRQRVLSYSISCSNAATDVTFFSKSSGGATAITSTKKLPSNGVISASNPLGVFESKVDEVITVGTSNGAICGIDLSYAYVRQVAPTATNTPTPTATPTETPTATPTP